MIYNDVLSTVIPALEVIDEPKTSATFAITHPPILHEYPHLELGSIGYAVREVPHNGDDGPNQSERGADFVDFYQRNSTGSGGLASPVQQPPDQVTVDRLTPGKTYKIKLRAAYNGGGFVESREVQFQTRPYTGIACTILLYVMDCVCMHACVYMCV